MGGGLPCPGGDIHNVRGPSPAAHTRAAQRSQVGRRSESWLSLPPLCVVSTLEPTQERVLEPGTGPCECSVIYSTACNQAGPYGALLLSQLDMLPSVQTRAGMRPTRRWLRGFYEKTVVSHGTQGLTHWNGHSRWHPCFHQPSILHFK